MSASKAADGPKGAETLTEAAAGATGASEATPPRDPKWNPGFPLDTFRDAAIHLRRPFTPQAIKFKVQADMGGKGALVVSYIDARLVVERLNLIVPHLWRDDYKPLDGKHLLCKLTVDEIPRYDVGQGVGKTAYSDALKRAAVKFGVGVSLYAIPKIEWWLSQNGEWIKRQGQGQKEHTVITDRGEAALRNGYGKWLETVGEPKFGPALDHGDVAESVGDPDVDAEPPSEEGEGEPIRELLDTEEAEAKREEARGLYEQIKGVNGSVEKFPPGMFAAGLRDHGHSLEALDEYVAHLRARVEARP